ncbi:MAG TPA: hypothetical protein VLF66_13620, partial [Thermoanaerobaculia bacterium]|nr:hypothetical protein [Thermoanaerobaculia bacterium]
MDRSVCPVCLESVIKFSDERGDDTYTVGCARCGEFKVVATAAEMFTDTALESTDSGTPRLGPEGSRRRANASAWIREYSDPDQVIGSKDVPRLASLPTPGVLERCDLLLLSLAAKIDEVGEETDLGHPEWTARSWSLSREEAYELAKLLKSQGWLELGVGTDDLIPVRITFP